MEPSSGQSRVEPRLGAASKHQGLGPQVLDQEEVYEGLSVAAEGG